MFIRGTTSLRFIRILGLIIGGYASLGPYGLLSKASADSVISCRCQGTPPIDMCWGSSDCADKKITNCNQSNTPSKPNSQSCSMACSQHQGRLEQDCSTISMSNERKKNKK